MSLGNDLTPVVREETILNGGDITPATRLEWFLAKAAEGGGGGGGTVYSPVLAQTTKSVSSHWVSGFSGGPVLEDASYRVIVNGTTYEPLTGTAGEDGYICLGNTYVDDSDPSGDYGFGIFYKNSQLTAWLETGDSMTMQIDQIVQAVPVPTPAAADTGKVLTANNGAVEWRSNILHVTGTDDGAKYVFNKTYLEIYEAYYNGLPVLFEYGNTGPRAGIVSNIISVIYSSSNMLYYLAYMGVDSFIFVEGAAAEYPMDIYD